MKNWIGWTSDGKFGVEYTKAVLEALDTHCTNSGAMETGGILIGKYTADHSIAVVCEATPPPKDSKRGRSWFVRGINGLRKLLESRWSSSNQTYYIGEWHFHPASTVEPSDVDYFQMLEISRASEYNCKEPLLLIFCAGKNDGARIFRSFVCPFKSTPLEFHERVERKGS